MILYEPFRTRPLQDFHDELRFDFPSLPAPLFDYYLLRTAITMAREAKLVRRNVIITPERGVTRYLLDSPDGLDICAIMSVRIMHHGCGGSTTVPRTFTPPDTPNIMCVGGHAWYDEQEHVLHLSSDSCGGDYHVSVAVSPARDACELPEVYYTDHLPLLTMGTRADIMLIPNRPWTNATMGSHFYNEFHNKLRDAAVDTMKHKQQGGIKMQFGRVM